MPIFTGRPGIYLTPTGDPATATQRWHRDGVEIPGATGTSYTTASPADDGKLIEYVENVANLAGSAAEQRLTLQALPAPTGIISGARHYFPRGTNGRSTSKLTVAQRLFTNGNLGEYESLFDNSSASFSMYPLGTNFIVSINSQTTNQTAALNRSAINTNFVSVMIAVDHLASGDLGSNVVAKIRMTGTGIDETITISAPGGYTSGSATFSQDYFSSLAPGEVQLQGWSYYHEGAALDPATYWDAFFDAGAMPREITTAWPAGVTPSFYLPAVASSWVSNANDGADTNFFYPGVDTVTDV